MDSHFRGNDSNECFPNMSFLCKQESRKRKSIVTMKYKKDTGYLYIKYKEVIKWAM